MTRTLPIVAKLDTIGEDEMYHAPASTKATLTEASAIIDELHDALSLATAYLSELPHEPAHKIASAIAKARGQ